MTSLLIYHHSGLGDHFMCHGIVREFARKYDRIGLFSLPQNYVSVAFMYRDLPNVTILRGDDAFARNLIRLNAASTAEDRYDEVRIIGFETLNRKSGEQLEKQFYRLSGIPLEKKWDSFYVERDSAREKTLYDKIRPDGEYVFLHEDASRGFTINRKKISRKYAIVEPKKELTDNIFDYCMLIENAAEIHVIDSSFMFLIDCLKYDNPKQKLFIHRYARENGEWKLPILRKHWHIYTIKDYGLGLLKYSKDYLFYKLYYKIFRWK